eukprot:gene6853-11014_t
MKLDLQILFILLTTLTTFTITKPCFLWDNLYVQVTKTSKKTLNQTDSFYELEFVGRQNRGWAGILLSTNKSLDTSISIIGYIPNQIFLLHNHTQVDSSDNFNSIEIIDKLNFKMDGIFSFKVTLNESYILGKNYINIAQNYNYLPGWNNGTSIPKHTGLSEFMPFELDLPDEKYPFCTDNLNYPGRMLANHWTLYLASTSILAVLTILLVYFRNEQPLKSRFVAPLYCIIGTHMNLFSEFIFGMFPYEKSAYWNCSFYGFAAYAAIQFSIGIPCLMMIRYAILLQLHFYKRNYIKKHKALKKSPSFNLDSTSSSAATVTTNLSKRTKSKLSLHYEESNLFSRAWKKTRDLLAYLKSPWIFVAAPIIWVGFYLCVTFVIFAIGGLRCSEFSRTFIRYNHILFLFIALMVLISFVLLDFFLSLRRWIKCQWKIYLFEEDPFHYRVDMFTFVFGLFPLIAIWAALPLPRIFGGAIVDGIMVIALFQTSINALVITIFKKLKFMIQSKFDERNSSTNPHHIKLTPEMIFAEKKLLDIFIKFSDFEWSSENIYFVLDVNEYKKQKDVKSKRLLAIQIKENYFVQNVSPLELNVTFKKLKPCLKCIEENEFTNKLFDNVQKEVEVNICDTISRFIVSDEYKEYKKYDFERLSSLGL